MKINIVNILQELGTKWGILLCQSCSVSDTSVVVEFAQFSISTTRHADFCRSDNYVWKLCFVYFDNFDRQGSNTNYIFIYCSSNWRLDPYCWSDENYGETVCRICRIFKFFKNREYVEVDQKVCKIVHPS